MPCCGRHRRRGHHRPRAKRATDRYLDLIACRARGAGHRLLEIERGGQLLRQAAGGFRRHGRGIFFFACERARATLGGTGRVLQGEIDEIAPRPAGSGA